MNTRDAEALLATLDQLLAKPVGNATTMPPSPTKLVETGQRSRKAWTEDDYKIRGFRTPEEKAADKRVNLHTRVEKETMAKLRARAIELRVSLGDVIDALAADI